jgi:hypothetical protein
MLKGRLRSTIVLAAASLACVIGFSSVAMAASFAPQLRSPKAGKKESVGHVKFTVYVPDPANVINGKIFMDVSPKRIVKGGVLGSPKKCGFHCDIATMKRVGHSHLYTYTDPFNFTGNWQDTPGRYYWQAYYYPNGGAIGILPSAVGSFRIVG